MFHMPSFILSLQWKQFCNYLTNRPSLWKDIKQSFISDATLKCMLCSNLSLHNCILQQLVPFRFMQLSVKLLKKYFRITLTKTDYFG